MSDQNPKPREFVITTKTAPGAPDGWAKFERASKALSAAAIPLVLAVGGWMINGQIQNQSVRQDYVKIAVGILQEPDTKKVTPGLRKWATDLLKANSPTPLPEDVASELETGISTLPDGLFVPPTSTRSGDNSAAVVVSPDGGEVSILFDKLVVDLQRETDPLTFETSTSTALQIQNNPAKPVTSIGLHLRGFITLGKGATAKVKVTVGDTVHEYEFPRKGDAEVEWDDSGNLFINTVFPIAQKNSKNRTDLSFAVTGSATRPQKSEIAMVQIDSIDVFVKQP